MNTHSPCSVHVLPDPRRKQAVITCETPPNTTTTLRINDAPHQVTVDGSTITVDFEDAHIWSPTDPHVYRATIECAVSDGTTQSLDVPIGLRQFTVNENRFRINQRPIAIRGASIRETASPDPSTLDRLLALGYNAVRVPIANLTPEILDAADDSGMLIVATLTLNAPLSQSIPDEAAAFIHNHFNHPSLIAWHLRFRTDSIESTDRMHTIERYIASVHAVDPTRLILCEVVDTEGFPRHSAAANPNQPKGDVTQFARMAVSAPISSTQLDALQRFGDHARLVTADVVRPLITANMEIQPELIDEAVDDIVRALRMNDRVAGYWIEDAHALVEAAPSVIASSVHQPVRPIAEIERRNLLPGEETNVRVSLANDSQMTGRVELSLQVVGPTGQVLWKKKRGLPLPKSHKEIWRGDVGASSKPGLHRFVVRIMKDRRVLSQDDVPFHVLPGFEWSASRVHIVGYGPNSGVKSLSKIVEEIEAPVYVLPAIANTIWAYPAETVCQILALVQAGAAAVILAPPEDWDELTQCFDGIPEVHSERPTFSRGAIAYHTARHPILEGVRTADIMGSSYQKMRRNTLLTGPTDEILTTGVLGSFDIEGNPGNSEDNAAINDVIVQNFGEGKLVFVNYNPLAQASNDPAAENLLRNLVDYGARRAVPGIKPPPFQKAIDFWRKRALPLRRWRILAPLRADNKIPPPPAHVDDFEATFDGVYGPVSWSDWWVRENDGCEIDLADACQHDTARELGSHGLTGYAAHTFRSTMREPKSITLDSRDPARLWFNGRLLGSTAEVAAGILEIDVTTREGLNIVVIESTANQHRWTFQFSISDGAL